MIAQESRDREQARGHLAEALAIVQEAGDKPGIATILARLARATARRGLSVQAVRLYEAATRVHEAMGAGPLQPTDLHHWIDALRTALARTLSPRRGRKGRRGRRSRRSLPR